MANVTNVTAELHGKISMVMYVVMNAVRGQWEWVSSSRLIMNDSSM